MSQLARWRRLAGAKRDVDVPRQTLERIGFLMGVFRAINTLLPRNEHADLWVRAANKSPLFGGRSALQVVSEDGLAGLELVRSYLLAELHR